MTETQTAKHTPGPWGTRPNSPREPDGNPFSFDIECEAGHSIAYVHQNNAPFGGKTVGYEDTLANAHLIAAAPELLEALRDCAESLAFARDGLGICGEGDGKDRKADTPDDIGSANALAAARAAIAKATPAENS